MLDNKNLNFDPNPLFFYMLQKYKKHKDTIYPDTITPERPQGDKTRVTFCNEGSTRSSKTYDFYHFLAWLCGEFQHSPLNVYVIRKTLKSSREIAYKTDFVKCMKIIGLYARRNARNENTSPDYTLMGSSIKFRGLDSDEEFGDSDVVFVNEALDIDDEMRIENILMRCTMLACLDWNPKLTRHWVFKWRNRDNVFFTKTTFRNNKHLPSAVRANILSKCPWDFEDWDNENNCWKYPERPEVESEVDPNVRYRRPNKKNIENGTVNRWYWLVYGEGERTPSDSAIFKKVNWIKSFPNDCEEIKFGLDFGYTADPTALVKVGRKDMELYIEYLVYEKTPSPDDCFALVDPFLHKETLRRIDEAKDLGVDDFEIVMTSCDSADKNHSTGEEFVSSLNETKAMWEREYDFYKTRKIGIVLGLAMMKKFKIHVVDSDDARGEFENYVNKVVDGYTTNTPEDKFNHGIDAARYVVVDNWSLLVKQLVVDDKQYEELGIE